MKLQVLREEHEIENLISYIDSFEFISLDTETTGITQHDTVIGVSLCADPSKAFYIVLARWDTSTDTLVSTSLKNVTLRLLERLKGKSLIMHNGVFDCMMIESNFGIKLIDSLHTDTMILAHLLDENRKIGLKELSKQYFGEDAVNEEKVMKDSIISNGGSCTKKSYELFKADSQLIGEYGAKDALLTLMLFHELVPELYIQKLNKFFYEDESMPLLKGPTYQLNTSGLAVDGKALQFLKKNLEAECLEAHAFITSEISSLVKDKYPGATKKNTFSITSSQQLSWLLFGLLELEFSTLTPAGKIVCRSLDLKLPYTRSQKRDFIVTINQNIGNIYQKEMKTNKGIQIAKKIREPWVYIACDKTALSKHSSKYLWVAKLLEYQRKKKILTTYVKGIESRVQYGIIHPNFLQAGTTSGRYSSRNPNFQNLPRDDKRIKECVVSRPGKIFVGADYSQLEPRVFAYISQDAKLMKAFNGADDFYSVIGMGIYDKNDCTPRKEGVNAFGVKYKNLRDLAKTIALAVTYGATAWKLAPLTGKSVEETQQDIDNYFERFPNVKEMMIEAHSLVKSQGWVENIFGRKRRLPEAKKIEKLYGSGNELPYEIQNMLNLSVNHRIQSTGASIMNRATIRFYNDCKRLNIECKIVCQVHDSLIVECACDDAENVALLLQNAMENTTVLNGVPLEAIPKIGVNLAKV